MTVEIELTLWDRSGQTMLAVLSDAFDIQWQDALSDVGMGKFSLPISDLNAVLVVPGYLIRCNYRTQLSAYTWRIEEVIWNRVSTDEEFGEILEVSGRDRGVRFEDAVVYPPLGVNQQPAIENRSISFASPEFDDASWDDVTALAVYGDMNREWRDVIDGVLVPGPYGWPTSAQLGVNTYWIWSTDVTTAGICYFRQSFWVDEISEVTIIATADNFYTLYLDGTALLGDSTNPSCWKEHRSWKGELQPGWHLLAAVVDNISTSPAGFLCAAYIENPPSCDEEDPPNCTEVAPTVLVVYDLYWKCLAYPATEPGFTPGAFVAQLYNEARARGQLLDIELTFDAINDSRGQAWEVMPEVGANIGDTLFDVLTGLSNGFWIDWELSPLEYAAGGVEIPNPTGPLPPLPPPPAPPYVPTIIFMYRNSATDCLLTIWDDQQPDAGLVITFDVDYKLASGAWSSVVTDMTAGTVANAGGNSLPAGAYVPPNGGACWSSTIATASMMRVRARWDNPAVGGEQFSEWVEWLETR